MRAVFNSGIVVLAGVLALAACGDMGNLSRTSSENEYFACSLQPEPEAGQLLADRGRVDFSFECHAKQGRVQFNNLRVADVAGGRTQGELMPYNDEVVVLEPGESINYSGTVYLQNAFVGSGRRSVHLSSTITYPGDALEEIENLDALLEDQRQNPAKYNMLVVEWL